LSRLSDHVARFARRVRLYHHCCARVESSFAENRLRVTDVELVYSSSFLSVCSHWESLLEAVLLETVCGEESRRRGNRRFASFEKPSHLEHLLLFPGKDYVSIPNLKHAEQLAGLFISQGRPISAVSERNRTLLQQAVWVRNAIAHESSFALETFCTKVPGVSALPRSKRSPGAFLRHEFRQSPSQRRYELYFAAYQSAAAEIARAW
jgi:hypothetical protein